MAYIFIELPVQHSDHTYTGIKCLRCGMVSYSLEDMKQKYCGNCHMYHADMPKPTKKPRTKSHKKAHKGAP